MRHNTLPPLFARAIQSHRQNAPSYCLGIYRWMLALLLVLPLAAPADDVVIQSFDASGQVTFNEVTNATGYRVEWASAANRAWTNTWDALNGIPAAGSGVVTVSVPMLYRVVATVTNSSSSATNPPPGMVLIPAGSFVMGATTNMGHASYPEETPQHAVNVSAFYMDQYEVTKALWVDVATWANAHGYDITPTNCSGKAANHPVVMVTWFECVKWCNARSQKEGLTPCYYTSAAQSAIYTNGDLDVDNSWVNWSANGYRLPTEAEWEKAARGGTANHQFPWSDSDDIQHARANYYSDASYTFDTSPTRGHHPTFDDSVVPYTSPVGSFAANGYGLYDMAGNIREWCWDWYLWSYYFTSPGLDPRGAAPSPGRVTRGGDWNYNADYARVADRDYVAPTMEAYSYGFRCVRGL